MKAIDSSSVAKYVNREPNWEAVAQVLGEGCVSLELAVKEVGNSLWKRTHHGEIDGAQARRIFKDFVSARLFALADQEELYATTMEVATALGLPLYDAIFLALAKDKGLPLVTSDSSQAEAARKLGLGIQLIE